MSELRPNRIDHVSIAVGDLDAAVAFFTQVIGLRLTHLETNSREGVREAMLLGASDQALAGADLASQPAVQLISPIGPSDGELGQSGVAKFLGERGDGLHHLALRVADVVKAAEAARGAGIRVFSQTPMGGTAGSQIVFLHPKDCFGVLIELVQAPKSHG